MKINEVILTEGQDNLYHVTDPKAAVNILEAGMFKLAAAVGDKMEEPLIKKGYPYFMSTTRVKSGFLREGDYASIIFNLDGRWIGHRYYVKPVKHNVEEMEDRIYSNKPTMPIKAIQEIHVFLSSDPMVKTEHYKFIKKIISLAGKRNIPIFVYNDKNNWYLQNKRKALSTREINQVFKKTPPISDTSQKPAFQLIAPWIELYDKNDFDQLSLRAQINVDTLKLNYHHAEEALKTHVAGGTKPYMPEYEELNSLIGIMKKNKWKTLSDFLKAMRNKWVPKLQEKNYENQ